MSGNTWRRYPAELKERAVRMVTDPREDGETEWSAMNRVAHLLGVGSAETVRKWVRQAQVDAGARAGITIRPGRDHDRGSGQDQGVTAGECRAAARELDTEVGLGFLCGPARPALQVIVDFIREHADRRDPSGLCSGIEPICAVRSEHGLQVAPSTYYDHLGKGPSARQERDESLTEQIRGVHGANYSVFGARKVWLR